uniref:phosphatidylinositol-3,4,5-trisphosphate 5-phosphatase n=1 Tax=Cynoglossus semilaevis TaxID=244447 RepID=A0A3P8UV30_CYNSE
MQSYQSWYHGNITRSKAEDLLAKAARDGSFLIRDSESIQGAYGLCVLYQSCVYTYRILPSEDKRLSVQASEGVPIRFFMTLSELVDAYFSPNMGLITNLQHSVQREEEAEEEQECPDLPPQLPPRTFTAGDVREPDHKSSETLSKSLSDMYLMRLQHMDMSTIPEEHHLAIQEYFSNSICLDVEQIQNGNPNLPGLRKLIMSICKNLNSEISNVLPALQAFHKALDQQLSPGIGPYPKVISVESGQAVSIRLEQLTKLLYSIEDKAKSCMFESVGHERGHRKSLIPVVVFEVKQESLGISTKMFLKVDVEAGKLYMKKSKDGPEDKFYAHNKILQLVKSQKLQTKLAIALETEKEKTVKKDIVFNDTKKREGFCQLLQQMKNKHSEKPEPDMISVFVGTWNMGNASPPHNISSWFQCKGQGKTRDDTADHIPHDIYVIGTQEDTLGEREWVDTIKGALRNLTDISFKQVAIHTLWNIRIVVLARPEHENRISHVCSNSVKTGIANTLGNKGAVGVSFMFNGTSFGFVNSHLTSGSEKKLRRNQNYTNILRFLNLGDKKLNPFDITNRFTHLFWLGDLNYRVEFPSTEAEYIVSKIKQQQYQELLIKDQLNIERKDRKVFLHFDEEEITFAPTYRFERDTREKYAYTKAKATGTKYNLPSWCDRVLRKSYPLVHVVCQAYGCTNDIMTSDHSPVFASFEVGVASQYVSKQDPEIAPQGGIQIMNCVAMLLTKSKTNKSGRFVFSTHRSCSSIQTGPSKSGLLTPIISDPEYLLDQHILICVKSTDCDESYGEGCVALRAAQFSYTEFQVILTHHGEKTGTLTGGIQLQTTESKTTEKLYGQSSSAAGHDISNPSYMGLSYRSENVIEKGWSYSIGARAEESQSKTVLLLTLFFLPPCRVEDESPSEMFDNPLYGAMGKTHGQVKDQDLQQRNHLLTPESMYGCKPPVEADGERPPLPTPRNRSFTCSENKPQSPAVNTLHPSSHKKPVVPSRSEGGISPSRPPLPAKSRPGDPQTLKPRDYRDNSELPNKLRLPARPGQSQSQKDGKEISW